MGNLKFDIVPSRTDSGPAALARIKAVSEEFRGAIKSLVQEAVSEGARNARQNAPRGLIPHEGARLQDAIVESPVVYHPGGAGGGGYWEATFSARSEIAPQVEWVFEGTPRDHPGARIYPAQGNIALEIKGIMDKGYRAWTHGQLPQRRWWEDAEVRADEVISAGVRSIHIP